MESQAADLSYISLIMRADIVVQLVMLSLVLASVWTWGVIISMRTKLSLLHGKADAFEEQFWSGLSLDDLLAQVRDKEDHPMANIFISGMQEWEHAHQDGATGSRIRDRIGRLMAYRMETETEFLGWGLPGLATVASVAPFIGLFGTVWGIMNSFRSIAASQSTSLVVVAPGIAEALFATALGLFAAIPAVIAYNRLSVAEEKYLRRLEKFSEAFQTVVGRETDRVD
ncbi:MAG: protein TolQ [Alphaproteobacteria bacterium]|nr:protein TolQ [Alphaproteobacteria bacterium]